MMFEGWVKVFTLLMVFWQDHPLLLNFFHLLTSFILRNSILVFVPIVIIFLSISGKYFNRVEQVGRAPSIMFVVRRRMKK